MAAEPVNMNAPADPRHPPASALFLREDEVRRGLELLHIAQLRLNQATEAVRARHGLGRAHQRALYFIARNRDASIGRLLVLLGVTKQSLSRVVAELVERNLIEMRVGRDDRRQRLLRLTAQGEVLEAEIFECLRRHMAAAYARAGQDAVSGYWAVLDGLGKD